MSDSSSGPPDGVTPPSSLPHDTMVNERNKTGIIVNSVKINFLIVYEDKRRSANFPTLILLIGTTK